MESYSVGRLKCNDIKVTVPGSKSITNRALLLAAMADGECLLKGTLFSDDSRYFLKALKDLGFEVFENEDEKYVRVVGCAGRIPNSTGTIYVGSAGTAARFLTAMLGLSSGEYIIDASEQMKKRPMKPLFDALKEMGASIDFMEEIDALPVKIRGCFVGKVNSYKDNQDNTDNLNDMNYEVPKRIKLDISKSTQFLSAFLMTGCMCKHGLDIEITSDKKTGSYIDITRGMVEEFGGVISFDGDVYRVAKKAYKAMEYQIEPDVSAACYFYGIAAIYGVKSLVYNVHFDSTQGDIRFLNVLKNMGCKVEDTADGVVVTGPDKACGECLKGIEYLDMNNFSDQALTLANVAVFADAPTTIGNIAHIRGQECDRLNAIAVNLKAMGVEVDEKEDSITIYPGHVKAADIETFEDHRVAMAFAMSGLCGVGLVIKNPLCCKKTFENYFEIIDTLSE